MREEVGRVQESQVEMEESSTLQAKARRVVGDARCLEAGGDEGENSLCIATLFSPSGLLAPSPFLFLTTRLLRFKN